MVLISLEIVDLTCMIVGIPAAFKRQGKLLRLGGFGDSDLLRVFDDNSMLFIHSNEIAPNLEVKMIVIKEKALQSW